MAKKEQKDTEWIKALIDIHNIMNPPDKLLVKLRKKKWLKYPFEYPER